MDKFDNNDLQAKLLEHIINGTHEEFLKEIDSQNNGVSNNDFKINLKFENKSNNPDPEYAKIGDSGFDIRANIEEPIILGPLDRYLIPTGLFFELPECFELQVRPRSGLAAKNGVTVLNTPGTVDDQYRGEVKIILVNLSNVNFTVNHGDRIAQGILANVSGQRLVNLMKVDTINKDTDRADGGFGSTGTK
jgi:dUTP pyrophosphatase